MPHPRSILISRTDAIGDVVLTLPLATILRQSFPQARIGFLGKAYTKAVIDCCSAVDQFVDVADFMKDDAAMRRQRWEAIIHVFPRKDIAQKARQLGIPLRIGTRSRPYHWVTCNKIVKLSRRHSPLHEAQLNTELLKPLGVNGPYTQAALSALYSFTKVPPLAQQFQSILHPDKRHVILHPKSQGSAREWGIDHFIALIRLLPPERYQIFISGTATERQLMDALFKAVGDRATDITGRMDLLGFISFIEACDALVAASTGPLHIAAAAGKMAIGIYPSIKPMHAGRWGPLGPQAIAFALPENCDKCWKEPESCTCIRSIGAAQVGQHIISRLP